MKMEKKYNNVLIFITGKVQNQVCISKVFYKLLMVLYCNSTSTATLLFWTTSHILGFSSLFFKILVIFELGQSRSLPKKKQQ